MATVLIPTNLRNFTEQQDRLEIPGVTISQVMDELVTQYPTLKQHIFDDEGQLNSYLCVFLNDNDIRFLNQQKTVVAPSDTFNIIPALAGG